MKPLQIRLTTLTVLVALVAFTRLLPHPPNFAPVSALALFGAALFERKWLGLLAPLAAMLLSDLVLGFHGLMPHVYGSFLLSWLIGLLLLRKPNVLNVSLAALLSSVLFFAITNFGVWYGGPFYPQTREGLLACYAAAIPFFQYTLLGDLFFSALLFGGYALLQQRFPVLQVSRISR